MKSTIDQFNYLKPTTATKPKKIKLKPAGGKAFQRIKLFDLQRGLDSMISSVVAERSLSKSKKAFRKKNRLTGKYASYAQAIYQAAISLKATNHAKILELTNNTGVPTSTGPQWKFIGPLGATNGQTYGDSRPVISGRISCIAIDPSNSDHILCGAASGGIWQSKDRGVTWSPRSDYMPTLTIGALAFDPSNPDIVLAGSGEGNFYAGQGAGLYKSTDGGSTWAVWCGNPFIGQSFFDLIVDPGNSNHILAATYWGLYDSSDGGLHWTQKRSSTCFDISISPSGGTSAEVFCAFNDGLYKSNNGGSTYSKINLPSSPDLFSRLAVSISPSIPGIVYVYGAAGENGPMVDVPGGKPGEDLMPMPYLWHRVTAGGTFSVMSMPSGLNTTQSWYDWFLAIAPDNATQIYLGAIEAYRGTLSNNTWIWSVISNKNPGDDIHPDQHAIATDKKFPDRLFVGNDGGLFYSPDRGVNWKSLNENLGISEIEYIAQDFGSAQWLLAGTQDNGSLRYTGDIKWKHVADGDGGDCGVNRAAPTVCFHTFYGMGMERSNNKGDTWEWIGPNVKDGYDALFYPPVEVNNGLVAQAGQSVFISRNRGTDWFEKSIPDGGKATAMYMPSSLLVYLGTENGNLYKYAWNGSSWSNAITLTSPRSKAYISDVYVDPVNNNRIWVTSTTVGGDRVWMSDNGGNSWQNRSAGLPSIPISSVEVHPDNPSRVWIAADVGVYQSLDAGLTWKAFSDSLPNAIASDLLYHPHAKVLRVALRNRGVWEIPIDGWLTNPICNTQFEATLAPNETKKWFSHSWPATWHMVWSVMPKTIAANGLTWIVSTERADPEHVTYWLTIQNLSNKSLSFEGRYAILSYY